MSNPIVLIHGYSDKGESFLTWKKKLQKKFADRIIHVVSYRTLTNEVSIKDIAEAFDRALEAVRGFQPELLAVEAGFDAYKRDPITDMRLEIETFGEIGRRLAALRLPMFALLEGG